MTVTPPGPTFAPVAVAAASVDRAAAASAAGVAVRYAADADTTPAAPPDQERPR